MTTQDHQFEMVELIGVGGFGSVYRARFVGEGGFSKDVALKVLSQRLEDGDEVAQRLRDEARMLGLLRHRAIVQVDRLTRLDGRWTIVMEYVEGCSLARVLRHGAIPPTTAAEIIGEIAGALHTAYNRIGPNGAPLHLLHRDIKPSNIQITPHGEVKVLDFGIARAEFEAREAETRSLTFGTLEYMSPERLDMQGEGPESDVYALGVMWYEMLVGEHFGRTSARRDRHETKLSGALARLDTVAGLPAELREPLRAMLTWTPEDRPTAAEIERRCLQVRGAPGSEPLRFWTERVVVPLMRLPNESPRPRAHDVDLTGTILVDRRPAGEDGAHDGAREARPAQPPPAVRPAPVLPPPKARRAEAPPPAPQIRRSGGEVPTASSWGWLWVGLLVFTAALAALGLYAASRSPRLLPQPDEHSHSVETEPNLAPPTPGAEQQASAVEAPSVTDHDAPPDVGQRIQPAGELEATPISAPPQARTPNARPAPSTATPPEPSVERSKPGSDVTVHITLAGLVRYVHLRGVVNGELRDYVIKGSADVIPGTYSVELSEDSGLSMTDAQSITIPSVAASAGVILECHYRQARCVLSPP